VPTNRNRNSTILLHAMDKTVSMDDVGSDTVMPSLYGLDLRINKYNNGVRKAQILKRENIYHLILFLFLQMKTVNCILIVRKDLQASNGVVHLVDSILEPYVVVQGKNLAEMIEQVQFFLLKL
jgi:Fasciclin domain